MASESKIKKNQLPLSWRMRTLYCWRNSTACSMRTDAQVPGWHLLSSEALAHLRICTGTRNKVAYSMPDLFDWFCLTKRHTASVGQQIIVAKEQWEDLLSAAPNNTQGTSTYSAADDSWACWEWICMLRARSSPALHSLESCLQVDGFLLWSWNEFRALGKDVGTKKESNR